MIAGGVAVEPLLSSPVEAASLTTFQVVTSRDSLDPSGPRGGDVVGDWSYRIDRDLTGDPFDDAADCESTNDANPVTGFGFPGYSGNPADPFPNGLFPDCTWPTMQSFQPGNYSAAGAPIVTQGDSSDFTTGQFAGGIGLEPGKYLISVTADGYKIGGQHFEIALGDTNTDVVVKLDPYPLPLVTLRARVFEDSTTNGQIDYPAEESRIDVAHPNGMGGFTATINDWAAEVSTDWYGNPLCTDYEPRDPRDPVTGAIIEIITDLDGNGDPTPIDGTGGKCVSDKNGDIVIPNLGPNRYAMTIAPPAGESGWIQTTTLEGGLDWDIWAMEGYTGYDTEFNVGGEAVPWVNFGYVRKMGDGTSPVGFDPGVTGGIKGTVGRYDAYTPGAGQGPATGTTWGGFSGTKVTGPIEHPMVSLLDLQNGDEAIWIGEGDADGNFEITNVPDGEYQVTIWEKNILTLLDFFQVTVQNGQVVDTGVVGLTGWFSSYNGHVFLDYNENGRMDPGEPGVPDFGLGILRRENGLVENGQNGATTGPDGAFEFEAAYPYTMWTVMEAYSDRYHTTGVTYQASNQPTETTVLGGGVDIHVLPIIGQSARIDWGVVPYKPGENGSIAGTVFYDTTRNELDARVAAVEDWSTGLPGITLKAYNAVWNGTAWVKGAQVDEAVSETWERPGSCTARDADGAPITDQLVFPYNGGTCIEAPLTGIQVDPLSSGGELGIAVNGNFGFGDLNPGKYIVEVEIPEDQYGRPLYRVEDEESVNVFAGDVYTPQYAVGTPSAGGGFDLGGQMDTDGLPVSDPATQAPGASAICVGAPRLVDITGDLADNDRNGVNEINPPFADAGGTPYQGVKMPGCEAKLIEVVDGRSVAPAFTLYNDVPPPAHFWGYSVDDLNVDVNPHRATFGEVRGLSYSPTGVYDWSGRLVTHTNADANGIWEVLLPSTTTMNCPTPSGVCPGMYRFVGNDPGPALAPFEGYNPNYRTIAAIFQAWPGVNTIADTAPTQVGASIQAPGGLFNALSVCAAEDTTPQVFAVDRPYYRVEPGSTGPDRRVTITGNHFFDTEGDIRLVDLDTDSVIRTIPAGSNAIRSWTDDEIVVQFPNNPNWSGRYQLEIVRSDGARPVNSITYHIIALGAYDPEIVEVGPGYPYATIQSGIDAIGNPYGGGRDDGVLVVVYPASATDANPAGAYFENLIISTPVKVQGVGAGGTYENGTGVVGTVVHGGDFWAAGVDPTNPFASTEPNAAAWYARLESINWRGNQNIADGAVISVYADRRNNRAFREDRMALIDGLKITGGDQRDFPGNIAQIGGISTPTGAVNAQTQGGGLFINGFAPYFHVTNNLFVSNGGAYGGAIRLGTPFSGDNENDNIVIARNRIVANGGTQLAGAIGVFNGADDYVIADNDICGNSSLEYGGAVAHFGFSPGGSIHHNRITLNSSYDEGGGILIGGELPADATQLSEGAGPVAIRNNFIAANLSNDDGGGIRYLQAGNYRFDVTNNMITNNVSTHQGGGISLNDAPNVQIVNNTIAHNITTATAITSDGQPAPAGLATTGHSVQLMASLPPGSKDFSDPLLVNNIFSDNRAGRWDGVNGIVGIGAAGDTAAVNYWDVGRTDSFTTGLTATNSIVDVVTGVNPLTTGLVVNPTPSPANNFPVFADPTVTAVEAYTWRNFQRFRSAAILSYDVTTNAYRSPIGDDHILVGSPATDAGIVGAEFDFDNEMRPTGVTWDIGADELAGTATLGPLTDVLDTFTRGTDNNTNINLGLSPAWWEGQTANSRVVIQTLSGDRVLRMLQNGTQTWIADAPFGDAQEAYVTFDRTTGSASSSGVFLRATGLNANGSFSRRDSSYVEVAFAPYLPGGNIIVRTKNPRQNPVIRAALPSQFRNGDSLLARMNVDDDLEVYRFDSSNSVWVLLGTVELGYGDDAWPVAGTPSGGRIGITSTLAVQTGRLDDFGGGEVR